MKRSGIRKAAGRRYKGLGICRMIHVFIGTKAQFIKMAPLIMEMGRRGMPYHLIETGQHAALTANLIEEFGLHKPDTRLQTGSGNIATLGQAALWSAKMLFGLLSPPEVIKRKVFHGEGNGICLIHGDTLSTLFSLLYARRCGIPVAHLEAGLRSFRLFDPFPEELIRLAVMRYSNILFAPSDWAMGNLSRMCYQHKSINIRGNTILDTIRSARVRFSGKDRPGEPYVVVTIHRVETLYSSTRMNMVITFIEEIAMERRVLFILHGPTQKRLAKLSLLDRLQRNNRIEMMPLQPYLKFLNLLAGADFAVTDGGSIQEECYSLNIPCLIMRAKTERMEGLGENAILSGFTRERFEDFMKALPGLRRRGTDDVGVSPSVLIIDHMQRYLEDHG
ncbi:MAG: UDP-N-acetylglucosamine 2-epimerase [Deltaproteobacteria bacterium]|nr:UDP-N-acetylglucosamine 2-epimerase [Deltaproteobacteria bacterium]